MRIKTIYIMLLGLLSLSYAGGNGGFGGAFLRVGLGARAISMGNAQVATADNGFGFYYNPAAAPYLEKFSANISYDFLSLDRRYAFIGISSPRKPNGGLSLGLIYSGVGDIQGYNSNGEKTEKIKHGLYAIYFSVGLMIKPNRLSIGISAKYLREDLSDPDFNYDGKGFAADLGIMYKVDSHLSLGYQIKDINGKLKSNTNEIFERGMEKDNEFPVSHRIGFYYHTPLDWIRAAYDFEWSTAGQEKNHLGFEFVGPGVAGRIGYDSNHFTFGGGLEFDRFKKFHATLNYAFVSSVIDEGSSHIFSWEFTF